MNRARLACAAAAVCLCAQAGRADPAPVSFKGKTINIYIGFDPGGTYDLYGRIVGHWLGKHLPGDPTIVPQNMPGAGSFTAANFLYAVAPRDGTALGVLTETIAVEEALHTSGVKYKSSEFNWIGRMTSIVEVTYMGPKSKVKTIDDARKIETPLADTGAGSSSEGYPKLLNALAGTKFKLVTGYPGSTQAMMAVESGEVDGAENSWSSLQRLHPEWLRDHLASILVQYDFKRIADLPDAPTDVELGTTDAAREMLKFYTSGAEVGRSLAAPPGLSADVVKTLRDGFDAMLKDPGFLAEVAKDKVDFIPASGAELQTIIHDAAEAPADVVAKTKAIVD